MTLNDKVNLSEQGQLNMRLEALIKLVEALNQTRQLYAVELAETMSKIHLQEGEILDAAGILKHLGVENLIDNSAGGQATAQEMLREANDVLRSAYMIASRQGVQTNWDAFTRRVKKVLEQQHKLLYSTTIEGADTRTPKTFRQHQQPPSGDLQADLITTILGNDGFDEHLPGKVGPT